MATEHDAALAVATPAHEHAVGTKPPPAWRPGPDTGAGHGRPTESNVAFMVPVPVVVGSLGRILVGALTDR